jgi:hypothetical protein
MLEVDQLSVPFVDHAFRQIERSNMAVSILGSDTVSVVDRCVTFQGHIHLTTWYHIPEDLNFQQLNSENLCFFMFDYGAVLFYFSFCFISIMAICYIFMYIQFI